MRTVVITGANSGLGFQATRTLARMGERIVMACRNMEKARNAQAELLKEVPGAETLIIALDVSEPGSIRGFGDQFSERVGELDLLINNAGVVALPLERNSVGHEMQLATNYLGAFALTGTLLPFFRHDADARIVNVGSVAHRVAKLDLADLNWERTAYNMWKSYARSKLAMLTFTMELNRRLQVHGSHVTALAAHPGMAATEISTDNPTLDPANAISKRLRKIIERVIPHAARGAEPILHAACHEDARAGEYYGPAGVLELAGRTEKARVNPAARDIDIGRRLWAASETMTGVRYLTEDAEDAYMTAEGMPRLQTRT